MSAEKPSADILDALRDPRHSGHLNAAAATEIASLRATLRRIAALDDDKVYVMARGMAARAVGDLKPIPLPEPGTKLPANLVKMFVGDLRLSERRDIATKLGLVGDEPANQSDFERAKLWMLRAAEHGQLQAMADMTMEAIDAR